MLTASKGATVPSQPSGLPEGKPTGHIIGVDVGGTRIRAAVADVDGVIETEGSVLTDRRDAAVIDQLLTLFSQLTRQAGREEAALCAAVIGVPGVPDHEAGVVRQIPNVPALQRPEVISALGASLAVLPDLENDVNLAALGEWHAGSHDCTSLAALALGTAVGLGVVIDGTLFRGEHGTAGEIARLPFGGDPFDESSYEIGALETVVSTAALVRDYRDSGGPAVTTAREVFDAAAAGARPAQQAIDQYARNVARVVMAVQAVLDPGVIALTGGIGANPELFERVAGWLRCARARPELLMRSRLGARAGLIGAIAAAAAIATGVPVGHGAAPAIASGRLPGPDGTAGQHESGGAVLGRRPAEADVSLLAAPVRERPGN
jgi:glucokinase